MNVFLTLNVMAVMELKRGFFKAYKKMDRTPERKAADQNGSMMLDD